jgi:DNA-binding NarL/FixJ family response regulator
MTIATDLDTLWTEKKEREAVVEARAALQNCMFVVQETQQRVKSILDAKSEVTAKSVGDALTRAIAVVDAAALGFADKEVAELLGWEGK